MPLPQLSPGVDVRPQQGPQGAFFLLCLPGGREPFVLNPQKFAIVDQLAKVGSYQALAEECRKLGFNIHVGEAEQLIEELRAKALVADAPAPTSAPAASPSLPRPAQRALPRAPRLLRNLDIRPVAGAERPLFEVRAPGAIAAGMFSDVDLTVAGLMDGSRDLAEIVAAALAAGIPASGAHLEKFVRELAAYHLLDDASHPGQPDEAARTRAPAARVPAPAATGEATGDAIGEEGAVSAPASALLDRLERGARAGVGAARAWLSPVDAKVRAAIAALPPLQGRTRQAVLGGLALVGVVVAGRVVRLPVRLQAPARFTLVQRAQVPAPSSGTLVDLVLPRGQEVARGEVLGHFDGSALEAQRDRTRESLARVEAQLQVFRNPPTRRELERAKKQLAALRRRQAKLKRRADPEVARAGQQALDAAATRVAWMRDAGFANVLEGAEKESLQLRIALADLAQALKATEVTAPEKGVLLPPEPQPGETAPAPGVTVRAGQVLFQVGQADRTRLEALLTPGAPAPEVGDAVTLVARPATGKALPARVMTIRAEGGESRAEVQLLDPAGAPEPGTAGELRFTRGTQSAWAALLRGLR